MLELNQGIKYSKLKTQLSRFQPGQIIARLIQQISLNEEKSMKILKQQNRISELEIQLRNLLASTYQTTKSKPKQLDRSCSQINVSQQKQLAQQKYNQEGHKWHAKMKQLTQQTQLFTKQNSMIRQQFMNKHQKLSVDLQQSKQTNEKLIEQNNNLATKLQQAISDIKILTQTSETLKKSVQDLKLNNINLFNENQQLVSDNCKIVQEYKSSVQIIQKLLKQSKNNCPLDRKQIDEKNKYNDLHLQHCVKQVKKYEAVVKQMCLNQVKSTKQLQSLVVALEDNQYLINRLERQNNEFKQNIDLLIRHNRQLQTSMRQLKQRNISLQTMVQVQNQKQHKLEILLKQKQEQVQSLRTNHRDRTAQMRLRLTQLQQQNQIIKKQFVLNNEQLQEQIQFQQKVIDDYERASKQRPKQLNSMKDKILGGEKRQFKLNQFQMKVYLDNTSVIQSEHNNRITGQENRQQLENGFQKVPKRTHDKFIDKTINLTEIMASNR